MSLSFYDYTRKSSLEVTSNTGLPIKGSYQIQTGTISALNGTVFGTFDAVDMQSVSLQYSTTNFNGTLTFQVSIDGVNWNSKALTASTASQNTSITMTGTSVTGTMYGDIGARYFRVIATAYTAGTISITALYSALSATPPINTAMSITGNPTLSSGRTEQLESTTNLGAGATYTGAARDMGTGTTTYSDRVRLTVLHTAGLTPGHLVIQESTDNTTFRETWRSPVPSDANYHTFEVPLHYRYYKVLFVNGATAQTAFYLNTARYQLTSPTINAQHNLNFPLATTALGVSATYTGPTLDLGGNHNWNLIRAHAYADQAGTLLIQQSRDGSNWRTVRPSDGGLGQTFSSGGVAVAVGGSEYVEAKIIQRYVRIQYVNGATAQTAFSLDAALVSI